MRDRHYMGRDEWQVCTAAKCLSGCEGVAMVVVRVSVVVISPFIWFPVVISFSFVLGTNGRMQPVVLAPFIWFPEVM